jgi:hypothetical protein
MVCHRGSISLQSNAGRAVEATRGLSPRLSSETIKKLNTLEFQESHLAGQAQIPVIHRRFSGQSSAVLTLTHALQGHSTDVGM